MRDCRSSSLSLSKGSQGWPIGAWGTENDRPVQRLTESHSVEARPKIKRIRPVWRWSPFLNGGLRPLPCKPSSTNSCFSFWLRSAKSTSTRKQAMRARSKGSQDLVTGFKSTPTRMLRLRSRRAANQLKRACCWARRGRTASKGTWGNASQETSGLSWGALDGDLQSAESARQFNDVAVVTGLVHPSSEKVEAKQGLPERQQMSRGKLMTQGESKGQRDAKGVGQIQGDRKKAQPRRMQEANPSQVESSKTDSRDPRNLKKRLGKQEQSKNSKTCHLSSGGFSWLLMNRLCRRPIHPNHIFSQGKTLVRNWWEKNILFKKKKKHKKKIMKKY